MNTDVINTGGKEEDVGFIVTKYLHKGFDSLSPEELATTLVNPDFGPDFKRSTGKFILTFFTIDETFF